jgi:MFS transporter, DHA1 family, staphyloferrin B biosynthesis exporter
VIRPVFQPSAEQRAVGRNLALDLLVAVGIGITMALVTTLLPTIARRGGLEPIGLAALGAAPFVANLLGAFAGRVGPRTPRHLGILRALGAASLVVFVVQPPPVVTIALATVYWISLSFGSPFYLRLWGGMYPSRLLGRLLGVVGMVRAAAGALAAVVGGLLADRLGGPPAVAIAGGVGVVCAVAYFGLRARNDVEQQRFTARESITALRERPVLARVALAQGFYGGGIIAAIPLFALVHVDRLDLTLSDVGVIGVLTAVATMVAFLVWGAVSDRFGPLVAMRIGAAIGASAIVAYALAPDVAVLWAAAVAMGIGSASIDVGISSVVSDQTTLASRAAAMAGWNAITGARGIAAAFVMSILVQLGVVDVTVGLLLCAVASIIGVLLFVRTDATSPAEALDTARTHSPSSQVPAPVR